MLRLFACFAFTFALFGQAPPESAREIVRKTVERDQANWRRAPDYTWTVNRVERRLESDGKIKSEKKEAWETVILYGEPHRRFTVRNSKPLTPDEQRKEQAKLDQEVAKLRDETPQQKQRRLAAEARERQKEREFLLEIPDAYNLKIERDDKVEGRPVWVISATPKSNYRPKRSDGKDLLKVKGTLWIDKAEYQWVRVEAETIATLTWGLFIGRINPGARLVFDQTRVNDEIWLPKRSFVSGSGRLIGKKIALQEEVVWSNFRKFHVESNIVGE
ncbi:MAG TPA: hypothetical protein VGL72_17865 [Bryobacteraceae bacterium]|jgi:hypothetical protein